MKSIDTSNNIITLYRNLTSAHPQFGWQSSSVIYSGVYNFDHMVKNNKSAHQVDLSPNLIETVFGNNTFSNNSNMVSTHSTFSKSTFSTNTKNQ
ncbi:hypothetical protein QSV08_00370 [Maribacter sp. BPC-D8]|uniref:hypothetical protein n=1 Tax=Maribacter sp. BPC-D8 TaxID=3053613 RepID=UPI002B4A22D9|nr:hypothetical protein [Maribacter sp. BPC-D8]WRI29708.1 hypothetical protein QSV08_00370 [Maribacter sp. BPC-D8]